MKVQKKVIWRKRECAHRGGFQPGDSVRVSPEVRFIGGRKAMIVSSHRRLEYGRVAVQIVRPLIASNGSLAPVVWSVSVLMLKRIA